MSCLLLLTCTGVMAQGSMQLTGTVADGQGKAIVAATILLNRSTDSVLVKTAITQADGTYVLPGIKEGLYFITASAVGYATYNGQPFTVGNGSSPVIPAIKLLPQAKELGNVTISARKPLVEVKADKMVFNVENSITAQGSNGMELLQRPPGLMVDNNDNITMMGKTGVRVYVDGKMLQMAGADLAAYLRGLNSNDIEAIEMISNPSAKYDASGNAGIINIRLKKNKKYGTNGSTNLGLIQGITPKVNGGLNLNYRDKKVNLFGNLGVNRGNNENQMDLYRIQNDSIYDQRARQLSRNLNGNAKVGADYFIDRRQTVGVMATVNAGDNRWGSESRTWISDAATGNATRLLDARNEMPGSSTNANFNANYRFVDTTGREINVDADYGLFRSTRRSFQPNIYLNPDGSINNRLTYSNYTPTDIDIYTLKVDAEQKAWGGKLGYGAKVAFVNTRNTFDFFNVLQGKPELDENLSNRFTYKENVNAAYVNFNRQLGKAWSLQTGLRMEHTHSLGTLTRADGREQEDGRVERDYIDLFPSAAITWVAGKKHSWNLTYSRRIDRPTYQELNPFENKLDELTYQKGNAFLRPQYTDNVELTHTFLGMINTKVGYSYVKDFATQITDTTNGSATYIQERNLATQQIISFSIGAPTPVAKWWNGYVNLFFNYQMFKGTFNNGTVNEKIPNYGAYVQQTFTLSKKGLAAEASGWYSGPSIWGGTWRTKPMGNLDIGIQQPVLKRRATVKLSVTDVLRTNYWRAASDFAGLYIKGSGRWESQTLRLNFTYRFGSNEIKASRQRKTGLEQEAGRIKG
ncbi:MAG TPA: TonB-dependent receptor [Phnomibacter sp.]|nr:TonB-dependent receptor [Phnomibacter sp.]